MKFKFAKLMASMMIILALVSCASTPTPDPLPDTNKKVLPDFLVQARGKADDIRAKALAIKANVAAKESFNQGEEGYTTGSTFQEEEDWDNAAAQFTGSMMLYQKAYDEAVIKRDAALNSLTKAEEERKASEEVLNQAEEARKASEGPTENPAEEVTP